MQERPAPAGREVFPPLSRLRFWGTYVKAHTGAVPAGLTGDWLERHEANHRRIQRIGQHRPWTVPACGSIVDRLRPEHLTHEPAEGGI